ncbi:MAG: hypothetical protein ABFD50_17290 [Smithella sp.]
MIGIYLSPDETQIVQAKYKNKKLKVELCAVLEPYLDSLKKCDVNFLIALFQRLQQSINVFYEEFYIVLPDSTFLLLDCYDARSDDEEEKMTTVETRLNRTREEFYAAFPLTLQSGTRHKETMIAIDRAMIDALITAAKAAHITLVSVEPASFAYLRCARQWRKEYYLLEAFQNEAVMIAFSPIAGMFRLSVPELAVSGQANSNLEQTLQSVLSRCDAIANRTFEIINTETPVTILAQEREDAAIRLAAALRNRTAKQTGFPEFAESDIEESEQKNFIIPLGGLLPAIEQEESDLYASVPEILHVRPANVLPQDVRLESHLRQVKRITKKYSKILCGALSAILALQLAGILYFNSIVIPTALQTDYDKAQSQMETVKKETELIKSSKTEHQYPIEALTGLLSNRPQNLGFTSIEIGRKGATAGKEQDKKWITFIAKSNDPMVFRDYATQLGDNFLFRGINISQISTDTSGLKSATVFIGKGTVR